MHVAPLAIAGLLATAGGAFAQRQGYPERPIRVVVPFGPGGATDIVARSLGQKIAESWNQTVVVDNRGGAGGIIGTDLVAKAAPDGYTLLLATAANAANVVLESKLPYDLVRDFAPVVHVVNVPFVLTVHPKVPAASIRELIALARAKPAALSYGTVGVGTSNHLMMELVKSMSGTDILHVPYKGVGPALVDLMGGRLEMMLFSIGSVRPYLLDGRLRAVGVTTAKRAPVMPDVPAIAEVLPGYDMTPWYGVMTPARTPRPVVDRLNAEVVRVLKLPDIHEHYFQQGFIPVGSTPEQFAAHIGENVAKLRRVVRDAKIQPQ
jgi:tripartite-type tricarboxylate transporter receptor subunit TctC